MSLSMRVIWARGASARAPATIRNGEDDAEAVEEPGEREAHTASASRERSSLRPFSSSRREKSRSARPVL